MTDEDYGVMPPQRIPAVHINWTLPFRVRNPRVDYYVEDQELLSTILSALLWRKLNGPIKLYTDPVGLKYYQRIQLLDLWDGGIDDQTLAGISPQHIDPEIFWAAGKLFAVRQEKAPFFMMDTDLMVWRPICQLAAPHRLMALHRESLATVECYIPFHLLKTRPDYLPNPLWDWEEDPFNTALVYFGDDTFLQQYTASAINFMTDNLERPMEMVSQMVFAEQRLFAMVAKASEIPVATFLDYPEQECGITHIWGAKAEARSNPAGYRALCAEMCRALQLCFPQSLELPVVSDLMKKYM